MVEYLRVFDHAGVLDAAGKPGKAIDKEVTKASGVLIDRGGVVREVFEGFGRGDGEQYLEHVQALLRE